MADNKVFIDVSRSFVIDVKWNTKYFDLLTWETPLNIEAAAFFSHESLQFVSSLSRLMMAWYCNSRRISTFTILLGKKIKDAKADKSWLLEKDFDYKSLEASMSKAVDFLRNKLGDIKVGKAHPNLVENLSVLMTDGSCQQLGSLCQITIRNPQTLQLHLSNIQNAKEILKTLSANPKGFACQLDSPSTISITIPKLTKELRESTAKSIGELADDIKDTLKSARRDALSAAKKNALPDDYYLIESKVGSLLEKMGKMVDSLVESKKKEIISL